MDFRIYEAGYKRWSTGEDFLTLASFITGIMGLTTTSTVLATFGIVFGVIPGIASLVPGQGRIDQYRCVAYVSRYTSINNSAYPYTSTILAYEYMGYDDNDLNSTARAAIDSSSLNQYYWDDATYYNDFSAQVQDAYQLFTRIGQKD